MPGWKSAFLAIVMMLVSGYVSAGIVWAQAISDSSSEKLTYKEDFNGDDPELMLGGQIEFDQTDRPWVKKVEKGRLVFVNDANPRATHYDIINWARFEGTNSLTRLYGRAMAVTVISNNSGKGGAGIAVLTSKRGDYWLFAVASKGKYHVLRKERGRLTLAYSGEHAALKKRGPNRISYRVLGNELVFRGNGIEITRVPFDRLKSREIQLALAAFGRGTFEFDDVVFRGRKTNKTSGSKIKKIKPGKLKVLVPSGAKFERLEKNDQKRSASPSSGGTRF
ncbi:hypothetical protein K1718_20105 [Roseibium porphyridii]|uniref:Uncharacterized protein n=1 Tax=Roseibium porphyridii TaxID=2866279 RepID=A0ABY8EZD5_9HYPH|nr:hypothetical protein [Roseibium sp. KMA01]WFE88450.1 hypothetical protein K1718_20105 [Roseibium sp. KMA01]